jgi:DNA-binding LacI/PurR family transcriptional regulator
MGPQRLDDDTEARLYDLLADLSLTRNEIAKRAGVGPATVSRHAERAGRSFDRRHTEVAVASRSLDVRARRVELANLLVEDAHRERLILAELPRSAAGMERAQLARTVATLSRAVVELDAAERDRLRLEADERQASGVDDYLRHLSGEATG